MSIQTLCDEAGTSGVIDDNCEQLQNFCNIIETLLCHRYRGMLVYRDFFLVKVLSIIYKLKLSVQNKKHNGTPDGITYWEFLNLACKSVPYSCIQKINQMDNVKTQRGKVSKRLDYRILAACITQLFRDEHGSEWL